MGTLVTYGRGRGVVTSTGMHTQLGLIASMLQNVEVEETPLQRRLDQLGRTLSIGALVLVAVVFIVALINNTDIGALFTDAAAYVLRRMSRRSPMSSSSPSAWRSRPCPKGCPPS